MEYNHVCVNTILCFDNYCCKSQRQISHKQLPMILINWHTTSHKSWSVEEWILLVSNKIYFTHTYIPFQCDFHIDFLYLSIVDHWKLQILPWEFLFSWNLCCKSSRIWYFENWNLEWLLILLKISLFYLLVPIITMKACWKSLEISILILLSYQKFMTSNYLQ